MSNRFFPPRPAAVPKIYAYEDTNPQYAGLLKIGYTTQDVAARVAQQYPTLRPGPPPYRIVLEEPAMRQDGTVFTDHDVHRMLRINGVKNPDGEWFRCTVEQVRSAIRAVREGQLYEEGRTLDFPMRPEQSEAVKKTAAYFRRFHREIQSSQPTSCGTAKCASARPLPLINSQKKWAGKECWCSPSSPLFRALGKKTLKPT